MKIMDAGYIEAEDGFKAGADYVAVMAAAHNATIANVVKAARDYKTKVLVDLMAMQDPAGRAAEVLALGADYVCVHTAFDIQKSNSDPLHELKATVKQVGAAKVAAAGGLNTATLPKTASYKPGIVIIGSAVTTLAPPARRTMLETLKGMIAHV